MPYSIAKYQPCDPATDRKANNYNEMEIRKKIRRKNKERRKEKMHLSASCLQGYHRLLHP
jgi:hypothetical protein